MRIYSCITTYCVELWAWLFIHLCKSVYQWLCVKTDDIPLYIQEQLKIAALLSWIFWTCHIIYDLNLSILMYYSYKLSTQKCRTDLNILALPSLSVMGQNSKKGKLVQILQPVTGGSSILWYFWHLTYWLQYTATVNAGFLGAKFGGNNDSDIGTASSACICNSTFRLENYMRFSVRTDHWHLIKERFKWIWSWNKSCRDMRKKCTPIGF